jgi:hypothetical protein
MTGNGAVLDFCGPFPDGDGIHDLTAGLSGDNQYPDDESMRVSHETIYRSLFVALATLDATV